MSGDRTRRQLVAGLAAWCVAPMAVYAAEVQQLPAPVSLAGALAAALARSQPLVVMASLQGCPFCKIVREHYLVPEVAAGLPVVQIDFRDSRSVRDFDGTARTHDALIKAWKVTVAPTVLFFGRNGREVAERLTGGDSDFYGAYLEARLQHARTAVRS
ncbi:hypothetical protein GFK26_09065 [Variovorax paradoxus]|uniref:Thioredoxin-like fold domain-containing protein n=1 Tax=Variovorax paradoxus TaxID=34073 RepID=A0A5Q0LZL8_VARPD|nr:hypothetical protein [Variovorax paradoxus]QFZ82900.1 hypothetical protein GFK26_09065 [Variovorax paradoxus]